MGREKLKDKKAAEQFFVELFYDAKTIAEKLDLDPATVGKWRKTGDWDKKREDTINDPVKMRRLIAKGMLLMANGEECNINFDGLYKAYKIYEGFGTKINPGIATAIMKMYDEFLAKENPQLALDSIQYNKQFIIHIIQTHG